VRPASETGLKRFNILIFGLMGSGKSSLINTLMTLMSDRSHVVANAAVTGSGEGHTTKALRATRPVGDAGGWQMWDTWGVAEQTYQHGDLKVILNGILANGFDLDSANDFVHCQEELVRGLKTAHNRAQHATLFIFPYTFFHNVNGSAVDPRLTDAKRFFDTFSQYGINPIILISQADVVEPQLRKNAMGTYTATEEMRKSAHKMLGIPPGHIHLLVNYTKETERDFNIDRNLFRIVEYALQRCAQFVVHELPQKDKFKPRAKGKPALDYGTDDEDEDDGPSLGSSAGPSSPPGTGGKSRTASRAPSFSPSFSAMRSFIDNLENTSLRQHGPSRPPLPRGWTSHIDPNTRDVYYVNSSTGQSQWDPPSGSSAPPPPPPPSNGRGMPSNAATLPWVGSNPWSGSKSGPSNYQLS